MKGGSELRKGGRTSILLNPQKNLAGKLNFVELSHLKLSKLTKFFMTEARSQQVRRDFVRRASGPVLEFHVSCRSLQSLFSKARGGGDLPAGVGLNLCIVHRCWSLRASSPTQHHRISGFVNDIHSLLGALLFSLDP